MRKPRNSSSLNFKHPFASIIFTAFIAILCGANDWVEVEVTGNTIKDWLAHFETLEKDHGRVDKRTYHIIDGEDLPDNDLWVGVKSIDMVIRERTLKNKTSKEIQYYINSIEIVGKLFEKSVRGHWGVNNCLNKSVHS